MIGGVIAIISAGWVAFMLAVMPRSESGFAEGLAVIFGGIGFLIGSVILAFGLWLPQTSGSGIQFTARQRWLLMYGFVVPIAGVIAIPVIAITVPPLPETIGMAGRLAVLGIILSGPAATIGVIGWKFRPTQ